MHGTICKWRKQILSVEKDDKTVSYLMLHFSLENMDKHKVKIDKDSNLYNLICNDEFTVNSIHKCKIDNAGQYEVKGFSEDGIIELLEMKNKKFNIGVQWHPELITEKKEQNLIFKKFIEHIINSKK